MLPYWVEGLFTSKKDWKKSSKRKSSQARNVEPFARLIWANSPEEALRLATEALDGGEWTDGPRVSKQTEEQRMRTIGAPQLPGFTQERRKLKRHKQG